MRLLGRTLTELRPLVAAIGEKLLQKGVKAEHGRQQQHPAIAFLDIGRVNDRMHQQTLRIDQDVSLFAADFLAGIVTLRIDVSTAFFRTLDALAVDHAGRWTGLPILLLAAFLKEFVVNSLPRSLVVPALEIAMQRASRRKVLGDVAPLTSGTQHI